ncbi:hypothetical protein [Neobacillus niacini]|uniref:hypothetical protein n=1 Tax=Neobacillus niacini TaxID=86668 RepID=UPI0028677DC7|nr:hypothetical protein [Neobacillus niacini]MDR7000302.1 hypothetical protein [Neobacillus niacini]
MRPNLAKSTVHGSVAVFYATDSYEESHFGALIFDWLDDTLQVNKESISDNLDTQIKA